MPKRMQVLIDEQEYRQILRVARGQGLTLAEWVRQTLRAAFRKEPLGDRGKKLAAVRASAEHAYPTADIDKMLEEISIGYQVAEPR